MVFNDDQKQVEIEAPNDPDLLGETFNISVEASFPNIEASELSVLELTFRSPETDDDTFDF